MTWDHGGRNFAAHSGGMVSGKTLPGYCWMAPGGNRVSWSEQREGSFPVRPGHSGCRCHGRMLAVGKVVRPGEFSVPSSFPVTLLIHSVAFILIVSYLGFLLLL